MKFGITRDGVDSNTCNIRWLIDDEYAKTDIASSLITKTLMVKRNKKKIPLECVVHVSQKEWETCKSATIRSHSWGDVCVSLVYDTDEVQSCMIIPQCTVTRFAHKRTAALSHAVMDEEETLCTVDVYKN